MSDVVRVKAGGLLVFSEGRYSDYGYTGHFVALEDITEARWLALINEANAANKPDKYGHKGDPKPLFISAAIRAGILLSVKCVEMHFYLP